MNKIEINHEKSKVINGIRLWPQEKIERFRATLLSWYDIEKRDLPWRKNNDPYRIWVSEIMLQQTRVDTVIPYYLNFMRTFPSIEALAKAEEDTLLKAWEGLGYYSRVRNMQKAAIQIMEDYDGKMPDDPKEIIKLKGIGPYTTGAIASMAFDLPEPAVDGNIMRILSRLFEIDADTAVPANRKIFEEILRKIIDPYKPGDFNQALMDLGATICTPKNYHPEKSPVKEFNQSYINETWEKYPVKSKKKKAKPLYYAGMIIQNHKGEFLLEKRPENGLLANMWTFPLIEEKAISDFFVRGRLVKIEDIQKVNQYTTNLTEELVGKYGLEPVLIKEPFAGEIHIFSHLKWHMALYYGQQISTKSYDSIPENCSWINPDNFDQYTFPGPQMKMWSAYKKKFDKK
ncbi:A/G-specific adenine glycosylase [Desemzia sp. RIT804]|uniref:A/G-specific adenine glycosylase n=1 Tax=Desemzia sp. RIT 804 TaxID=2810209 RepID=UPI0019525EC6|nr:A/G-specific adenine glycosylase [Desemzia sp. RIT 804]MBM6615903.1 A/G-specific adenine glycosylase [Desemzia sp. RIT 804]